MTAMALGAAGSMGGRQFSLSATDITDSAAGSANAGVTVLRGGTVTYQGTPTGNSSDDWVLPRFSTIGDTYDVRVTVNSGTGPNTGLLAGTWYALSSSRTFGLLLISPGTLSGNWTLDIRDAAGKIVASTTFTISATAT